VSLKESSDGETLIAVGIYMVLDFWSSRGVGNGSVQVGSGRVGLGLVHISP